MRKLSNKFTGIFKKITHLQIIVGYMYGTQVDVASLNTMGNDEINVVNISITSNI